MTSKEDYCIGRDSCDIVGNEKAPITSRGSFGISWGGIHDGLMGMFVIIALQPKAINAFYGVL